MATTFITAKQSGARALATPGLKLVDLNNDAKLDLRVDRLSRVLACTQPFGNGDGTFATASNLVTLPSARGSPRGSPTPTAQSRSSGDQRGWASAWLLGLERWQARSRPLAIPSVAIS